MGHKNRIVFITLLLVSAPSFAQLRLHDPKREAAAQDAKKIAEKIQSGDVFRKESANVLALIDQDVAATVADARLEMQSMINGLHQWNDVAELSSRVKSGDSPASPEDIEKRKQALASATVNLKNQINVLTTSAGSGADELKPFVDRLGNVDSVLGFAKDHLGTQSNGIQTAMTVLEKLQGLYKSYQDQFDAINQTDERLKELRVTVKKALLARLSIEEQYLLTQVALYQRYEKEFKDVDHLKSECSVPEGIPKEEYIDQTLDRLAERNREDMERAVGALFACGSLAAEGMLPGRLLTLRLAQLDHLRSIQLSAANARIYEAVLGGGVERLALFYQGGVKPEALAQLLQSLSTVGIFGKLLSQ